MLDLLWYRWRVGSWNQSGRDDRRQRYATGMCYALRHCVGLSVYQSVTRRYCIDSVVGVVLADQVARRGEMQVGGCENGFPRAGIGALNNTGINRGVSPKHYTVEFVRCCRPERLLISRYIIRNYSWICD